MVTSNSLTPVEEGGQKEEEEKEFISSNIANTGSEEEPLHQFLDYEYKAGVINEVGGSIYGDGAKQHRISFFLF